MKEYALDLWGRAVETARVARDLVGHSNDNAASRAYYAAFHAVSALFALENKTFAKHSGVEAAVHRDLVKSGRWPVERGKDYSRLLALRERGDYGGGRHVTIEEAKEAAQRADAILEAVNAEHPVEFPMDASTDLLDE